MNRFLIIIILLALALPFFWFVGLGGLLPFIFEFWQALPALAFIALVLFLEWRGRR